MVQPQVIPKQELEKLLAGRVKFHAEHREVLRTAVKTYLNGGNLCQKELVGALRMWL